MDKDQKKPDWSWLPKEMPRVSAMVKERRVQFGDAHVNECWRRGVVNGEPGWFFAREGALAVGTPSALCEELDAMVGAQGYRREPMLLVREPSNAIAKGDDGAY